MCFLNQPRALTTMSSSVFFTEEDEQYARDLQYAYDLQEREERKTRSRRRKWWANESAQGDGFCRGALNADHMLFVACTMDQNEVAMLIDTGASTSAMSFQMVQLLGLESKMNSSIHGKAKGVGSSSILGIVEHVNCMIGENVGFRSFFMVLEGSMPYCILGLDQMRRFNCVVDVGENALIFGGVNGVRVPFLPKEQASSVAYNMMHEQLETLPKTPPTQHAGRRGKPENRAGFGSYMPWEKRDTRG